MFTSTKKYFSFISGLLISFLTVGVVSVFAFSGVLPVPASGGISPTVSVSLSSYYLSAGQTATTTFTFSSAPASFTSGNVTVSNGTLSGLAATGDPKVYTALFTPTSGISATSNVITVSPTIAMTTYSGFASPYSIAFDGTNMWTANSSGHNLSEVSPSGNILLSSSPVLSVLPHLAFDGTNMWVVNTSSSSVSEVNPSGVLIATSSVGSSPQGIAFDGINMWVPNSNDNSVTKISPTGTSTTYSGIINNPYGIAFDGTNMWVTSITGNSVSEINPSGAVIGNFSLGTSPRSIAFDGTNMWIVNTGVNSVSEVNPSGAVIATASTGVSPQGIAFDGVNMWTANAGGNSVTKISPTGTSTTYSLMSNTPYGIAFDGTNMWTANSPANSVTKITPMPSATSLNYVINTIAVPIVTTSDPSSTTMTTTTLNGNITSVGDATSTTRGFNYGITTGYEMASTTETGSFSTGAFTANITGLTCGTTYHYQSYATNLGGTGTSTDATFSTSLCPVVTSSYGTHHGGFVFSSSVSVASSSVPVVEDQPSVASSSTEVVSEEVAPSVESASSSLLLTRILKKGMVGPDVAVLQRFLNSRGFIIAPTGNGSPGNESMYFGERTKDALIEFQNFHASVVLAPYGLRQGTGVLGVKSRELINKMIAYLKQ